MAYLHCHTCYWQQDDFWNRHYNPIRNLLAWESDLLTKPPDENWTDDKNTIEETGCKTYREIIARALKNAAWIVEEMKFKTEEEFYTSKDIPCPSCGDVNWDID